MTIISVLLNIGKWLTPCLKDKGWNFNNFVKKMGFGPEIFADVSTFLPLLSKLRHF